MKTTIVLTVFAALLTGCSTTRELSVTKVNDQAIAKMMPMIARMEPKEELSEQTKSLLTFLSTANIADLVETPAHAQGKWQISKIRILEPGSEVAVVCEEGHYVEVIYFSLRADNHTWVIVGRRKPDQEPSGLPVVKWK